MQISKHSQRTYMQNYNSSNTASKIIYLICLCILGFIITGVLTFILSKFIIGIKLLRISMILQNLFVFIMPAIMTTLIFTSNPIKYLSLSKAPSIKAILGAFLIFFIATPALNYIVHWNESISFPESMSAVEHWLRESENNAKAITDSLLNIDTIPGLILTILIVGVMTGFSEELFFRGTLQRIIISGSKNIHIAIWITAFIFSLLHFQFFGFFPRLLLGAFFGYLVWWTGSLWVPIIAHAINNSGVVATKYLILNNSLSVDPDQIGAGFDEYTVISIILTAVIIVWGRKFLFGDSPEKYK